MKRRSVLQAILGLFGFGAAKAVAKSDAVAVPLRGQKLTGYFMHEMAKPQFDAAIGVVVRGGKLFASEACLDRQIGLEKVFGDFIFASRLTFLEQVDCFVRDCAISRNAMIFADSTGVHGQCLVNELMKRCPERVWRRNREIGCGYPTDSTLTDVEIRSALKLENWETDDTVVAKARALALIGRNLLKWKHSIGCDISNPTEPATLVFGKGKKYEKTITVVRYR